MHYIGMMAMRVAATIRFDAQLFTVSVAIAIGASLVALQLAYRLRNAQASRDWLLKLGCAVVMGFAIAGMHYTGMAATIFEVTGGLPDTAANALVATKLFVAVSIGTFLILGSTLLLLIVNQNVISRLLIDDTFVARYWLPLGTGVLLLLLWVIDGVMDAALFEHADGHHGGFFVHLFTDDPNEIWMRALVVLTAVGMAVFGQWVFLHARALTREVHAARDNLEHTVAVRTAKLTESEARLIEAQRMAQLGSWEWGFVDNTLVWSDEIYRILGYQPDTFDANYEAFLEVVHPADRDRVSRVLQSSLKDIDMPYSIEHRVIRPDGEERIVHEKGEVSFDSDGQPIRMIGTVQDITEPKRIEEQLWQAKENAEQASRMKSEFLANMSHELRTPLNAIMGFTEIVKDGHAGEVNEMQHEYLSEVFDSSQHLLSLINDILDLSKIEAGKMELELTAVNIPQLLRNSLSIIKERAHNHGIKLELELEQAEGLGWVEVDERKFKQIVFNLLSNAVKFTPDGGRVGITAAVKDDCMEVSVWDTGIGINAEDQERLFNPFEQADGALGRKYEGTGLGLALVKNLTVLHGGQASLESVPGEGSRFAVRLPYRKVEKQNEPLPNAQTQDQRADTTNTQVPLLLLIEDDDQAAVLMMAHLKNAGYRTLWARSGEEGLRMAEEVHPDSVLLDILLPDVDGWKVLQRFKAKPELADIPVVVVSIVADTMKGLNLGALEALQKPVNRENLLAAVARATRARGGARQACRVSVVDDDARARELVCAELEHQGYTTLCAKGGAEALAQLQADPPDLVILDLMMPEVTGFDVLASLRKEKQTAQVPVIILSAKTLTDDERMFLRQHTAQVLGKSGFDSEAFLNSVDAVLNTGSLNIPSGFNG